MCKGQSTHVSEEAYEAFTHAAFVSGENRYHGWSVVAQLQTIGKDGRSTTFYVGKAKAPDAKAPDAKATDAKAPDAKAPDAKATDAKATDAKATDAKATDAKATDAKATDAKATDAQPLRPQRSPK
jgi:hypothetical protein